MISRILEFLESHYIPFSDHTGLDKTIGRCTNERGQNTAPSSGEVTKML